MKKLLFILFAIAPLLGFAQGEHLTFKGIPIDGNLNTFVEKLKSDGFTLSKTLGETVILNGQFVNKNCDVYVLSTEGSRTVWKVGVFLPEQESWYSLKSDYQSLKSAFIEKYGSPSNSYEFFSKPYYEGDGYEMTALRVKKCTYATFWNVSGGSLMIEINNNGKIVLSYEDAANSKIASDERDRNVSNDI